MKWLFFIIIWILIGACALYDPEFDIEAYQKAYMEYYDNKIRLDECRIEQFQDKELICDERYD